VQIIDENTGRLMQDRSWERGLHQLIETKECVDITASTETIAKISYQKFFHRYIRLGAMSGTASEVAGEIWSTYGLRVVKVPTHKPSQRTAAGTRVFATADQKWQWTVSRIRTLHELQRPILIGTRSVEASELLSGRLTEAKLPHAVLNARHHADEAKIIAGAGQPGRITIATNMAGRGTDIVLADGVADLGGLHVVMTEHNDAKRIDRQLYGRCGRQGDPGSFEAIMSLEDEIVTGFASIRYRNLLHKLGGIQLPMIRQLDEGFLRLAQRALERRHARARRSMQQFDEHIGDAMAFTGAME
jgi:preprotein translocase subunit SecA